MRVGLAGFGEHPWRSVNKTRTFYLDILQRNFTCDFIDPETDWADMEVDLLFNFSEEKRWSKRGQNEFPVINCIHGGATIGHRFLMEQLENLFETDCLLVNCESDGDIFRMMTTKTPYIGKVPLAVKTDLFRTKELAENVRRFKGDHQFMLTYIARLLPQKNLHGFLRILKEVRSQLPEANVGAIIVGNYWLDYPLFNWYGEQYPQLIKQLIEDYSLTDHINYFTGSLSDEDLVSLINLGDVMVHPTLSLDENFGYVVPEVMACGVPVIGAAYGGLKDTIDPSVGYKMNTWTTPNGVRMDERGGVNAIVELLRNTDQLSKAGQAAKDIVQRGYSLATLEKTLVDLVRDVSSNFGEKKAQAGRVSLKSEEDIFHFEDDNYLPDGNDDWNTYRPFVNAYVSHVAPVLQEDSVLYCYTDQLRFQEEQIYFDDPNWPMVLPANAAIQMLLEKIGHGKPIKELALDGPALDLVKELVIKGVLNYSNEDINRSSVA